MVSSWNRNVGFLDSSDVECEPPTALGQTMTPELGLDPDFEEWKKHNPWFNRDMLRTAEYLGIATALRFLCVPVSGRKFLSLVDRVWHDKETRKGSKAPNL